MKDELIARLKAADGGSQDLDIAIFTAVQPGPISDIGIWTANGKRFIAHHTAASKQRWLERRRCDDREADFKLHPLLPDYTTSIDAAMTLVPEGWTADVRRYASGKGMAGAWDHEHLSQSKDLFELEAATPELALCIAALRARLSQETPQ